MKTKIIVLYLICATRFYICQKVWERFHLPIPKNVNKFKSHLSSNRERIWFFIYLQIFVVRISFRWVPLDVEYWLKISCSWASIFGDDWFVRARVFWKTVNLENLNYWKWYGKFLQKKVYRPLQLTNREYMQQSFNMKFPKALTEAATGFVL